MKYTLLFWIDDATERAKRTEEEGQAIHRDVMAWVDEMTRRGILLEDHRLSDAGDTTTVSVRGGEVLLGDGPFAETKEQIVGYVVIEVADLDEAIEVAAADPLAALGTVEIRPLWGQ